MTTRIQYAPNISMARRQVVQEAAQSFSMLPPGQQAPFSEEAALRVTEVASGYPASKEAITQALANQQILLANTLRDLGLDDVAVRFETQVAGRLETHRAAQRN